MKEEKKLRFELSSMAASNVLPARSTPAPNRQRGCHEGSGFLFACLFGIP